MFGVVGLMDWCGWLGLWVDEVGEVVIWWVDRFDCVGEVDRFLG